MLTGVVAENGNSLIGVSVRPAVAQLANGKAPAAPINVRRVSVKTKLPARLFLSRLYIEQVNRSHKTAKIEHRVH
jgi:hypothetical protein